MNLLKDLQKAFGLTVIFISHNLSVVRRMSDDVVVSQCWRVQEQGPSEQVYQSSAAEITKRLLALTLVMPDSWRSAAS